MEFGSRRQVNSFLLEGKSMVFVSYFLWNTGTLEFSDGYDMYRVRT